MRPPLFIYGTLLDRNLLATLAGPVTTQPARLWDHVVEREADGHLPILRAQDGGVARGLLCLTLTADQWRRLDAYELPFGYDLRPVSVRLPDSGQTVALAYFPGPAMSSSGEPWLLSDWEQAAGPVSRFAAQELALHDPPLEGASLVRQWPMIRMRAEAQMRAATSPAPARLRHAAQPPDLTIRPSRPLDGAFFKLAGLMLTHRRFDGTRTDPLPREVLVGADAALVLPYDPQRGRVLLVEQFRPGPARRGDANPWSLEPVAGIIDAGETPQDAARREAAEEAHVTLTALQQMFAIYPSPGSTTDHFFCYLGLTDLPDDHPRMGGLAEENEDLRLHILPLDDALALIDTGEIQAGPLVAMLLWLARHQARLAPGIAIGGTGP
jgi:ADP-ribose pyrophosphatase